MMQEDLFVSVFIEEKEIVKGMSRNID